MAEVSPDVLIALRAKGDQPQSDELLIGPGLTIVCGIRNVYLNPGKGRIAIAALQWIECDVEAEIQKKQDADTEASLRYTNTWGRR